MKQTQSLISINQFRVWKHNWIRNPFVDNANAPQGFASLEAEQFIDLYTDLTLKSIYNPNSLISFWVKLDLNLHL